MEIKPTYVTFEQAKLLKEKGFKAICTNSYCSSFNPEIEISCFPKINQYAPNIKEEWDAPEQWQVIEWLRINHGIFVSVETDCYGEIWFSKLICCSKQNWENLDKRHEIVSAHNKFNNEHNSPQEAYSAAFDYVLNKLLNF